MDQVVECFGGLIPIMLKEKFYRIAVRPAMLYETGCWTMKKQHEYNRRSGNENVEMDVLRLSEIEVHTKTLVEWLG